MVKYVVVAGNERQAQMWARNNHVQRRDWISASENGAWNLRGIAGPRQGDAAPLLVKVGTYYERRDLVAVAETLVAQGFDWLGTPETPL